MMNQITIDILTVHHLEFPIIGDCYNDSTETVTRLLTTT